MIHIKKILCPVDFAEASDKALQYAAGLAEDYCAKMHLVHVVTPVVPVAPEYPVATVAVIETVEEAATTHMKKLVENLQRRGLEVTSKVLTGDVHVLIEQTIAAEEPDIIVMGSHTSGVKRLFMGSVSEWMVRNSPVPVLVISDKEIISIQRPRRVA